MRVYIKHSIYFGEGRMAFLREAGERLLTLPLTLPRKSSRKKHCSRIWYKISHIAKTSSSISARHLHIGCQQLNTYSASGVARRAGWQAVPLPHPFPRQRPLDRFMAGRRSLNMNYGQEQNIILTRVI